MDIWILNKCSVNEHESPGEPVSLFIETPLVVLAVPLPPLLEEDVGLFILLEIETATEAFGLPDVHVVGDLGALLVDGHGSDPVGQPGGSEALVVDDLVGLALGGDVVEEDDGENAALEEDEDSAATQLDDSDVEHVDVAEEGQLEEVVDVAHTYELLVGVGLDELPPEFLLEVAGHRVRVLEHLSDVGVVCPLPLCPPQEVHHLHLRDDLAVHILKVVHIRPVLRDVLDVALHLVHRLSPVLQVLRQRRDVQHRVSWLALVLGHGVDPDINETVDFADRVLPQPGLLFFVLHPFQLFALLAEIRVVFNVKRLGWLAIVIWFKQEVPTQTPVSPSYIHPWKGHCTHLSLITLPPMPKLAPRCLQQASSAQAFPDVDLNTTRFSPAMSTFSTFPLHRSLEWMATYQPLGQAGRGLPIFLSFWSQLPFTRNTMPLKIIRQQMQTTAATVILKRVETYTQGDIKVRAYSINNIIRLMNPQAINNFDIDDNESMNPLIMSTRALSEENLKFKKKTIAAQLQGLLAAQLQGLLREPKLKKESPRIEIELKAIIKSAQALNLRELLHLRYTNKLSYLKSRSNCNTALIDAEIMRVHNLVMMETQFSHQGMLEMENRVGMMFAL